MSEPAPTSLLALSEELWERVARLLRPADLLAFAATCRAARRSYIAIVRARRAPFVVASAAAKEAAGAGTVGAASAVLEGIAAAPAVASVSQDNAPQAEPQGMDPEGDDEQQEPVCRTSSADLRPVLTLPDSPQWVGHYSQATLSPGDGRYLVRVYVRCCERCNPHVDFSLGADIGAGAELWDTRTGTRAHFLIFNVKYPGKKRIDLRWVNQTTLCVIVGDACRDNDPPQFHIFSVSHYGTLNLERSLYVALDLPTVDLFDPALNDLADILSDPLPQVIRVQTDVYALPGTCSSTRRTTATTQFDGDIACPIGTDGGGDGGGNGNLASRPLPITAGVSATKLLVIEPRIGNRREPLGVQMSTDGSVLLVSDPSLDYARTFALESLPDAAGPVEGTCPPRSIPLGTVPARAGCSFCFLSPCGGYLAVLTSKFRSDDLQAGFTEDVTVTMYKSNGSTPLYARNLSMPVRGDFRPGQQRSYVGMRANCADAFFGDASSCSSDTFGIPMNDEGLPILLAVETGALLCVPDLTELLCDRPCRTEASHYQFSLNEDMILTFFSTQYGTGHGTIQVYDAIAPRGQKLISSLETPTLHRWRCEAHVSGFVLVENNCVCCASCVFLPVSERGSRAARSHSCQEACSAASE